jgi:hypothetical protein
MVQGSILCKLRNIALIVCGFFLKNVSRQQKQQE